LEKLKILIIADGVLLRKFLSDIVSNTHIAIVVHASPNIELAIMWLEQNVIDLIVISLDTLENTNANALKTFYTYLKPILIANNSTNGTIKKITPQEYNVNSKYIDINNQKFDEIYIDIISEKFKTAFSVLSQNYECKNFTSSKEITHKKISTVKLLPADIVLIASSTGGPVALETVFKNLPHDFSKPILVVQHIPHGFTAGLVKTIQKLSPMKIIEGTTGEEILTNKVIFAPGGYHMILSANNKMGNMVELLDSEMVNGVKPSADVLFKSVADTYSGKTVLVVVLTGMGCDGAEGVKNLKKLCNCYCITQKLTTCVAVGMPKTVQDMSLSDKEVSIENIANEIYNVSNGFP
jgi:two-component system chemotaxis response regulator CheB